MHQATAADSANRDETSEEIKAAKETRTAIVSSIMEKYTLADPWPAKNEKILTDPYRYLHSKPGKDIRAQMIASFNVWLQVPEFELKIITHVVEMLHTSSLLIDDVEDGSALRRGFPVAHSIYGIPQTINSANYVYFCALRELERLNNPQLFKIFYGYPVSNTCLFLDELINLHRGQGMDLFWRDSLTCPTEEEYVEMVNNKTGGLLRLAVKLMQTCSSSDVDYVPLVNLIGILFQIRDDYQNLQDTQYTNNKGLCEDITEGKFSFPIIHAILSRPDDRQLISIPPPHKMLRIDILKQHTASEEIKLYCIEYMTGTGSFAYTRRVLHELDFGARKEINTLGGNKGLVAILDRLRVETGDEVVV